MTTKHFRQNHQSSKTLYSWSQLSSSRHKVVAHMFDLTFKWSSTSKSLELAGMVTASINPTLPTKMRHLGRSVKFFRFYWLFLGWKVKKQFRNFRRRSGDRMAILTFFSGLGRSGIVLTGWMSRQFRGWGSETPHSGKLLRLASSRSRKLPKHVRILIGRQKLLTSLLHTDSK